MNYQQTLDYLYNTLPMFSRMGSAAFKKDLTNILALCERLGNPHQKFKSIHVAGTNGKGSVSHMLAAIFQTSGYKTGLYTSPHLYDFRERIRLNGARVPEQYVVDFVDTLRPAIEKIQPSFFEITVAMAFDYFSREKVDIAIIEVGLGGRLDSTNIIKPEISVITNIGWDHMNMLGNSLVQIAGEKAGIIKPRIPVVIGEASDETKPVFMQKAAAQDAPISFASEAFTLTGYKMETDHLLATYQKKDGTVMELRTDLPGIYQLKNMATVLLSVDLLRSRGWQLPDARVKLGFRHAAELTGLHGRWEVIHKKPLVVLEVAHNSDGIKNMLAHAARLPYRQLHIVLGMVKDKDVNAILQLLPAQASYYFTQAHIPRALDAKSLQDLASLHSLKGAVYPDANTALQAALGQAFREDLVIVCGSIFLVAEVDRASITQLA